MNSPFSTVNPFSSYVRSSCSDSGPCHADTLREQPTLPLTHLVDERRVPKDDGVDREPRNRARRVVAARWIAILLLRSRARHSSGRQLQRRTAQALLVLQDRSADCSDHLFGWITHSHEAMSCSNWAQSQHSDSHGKLANLNFVLVKDCQTCYTVSTVTLISCQVVVRSKSATSGPCLQPPPDVIPELHSQARSN